MEFTGQLLGGPDDGNLVTSSVPMIKAVDVFEIWPDGPDKDSVIYHTTGNYVWTEDDTSTYFQWQVGDTVVYKRERI